MGLLLGLRFFKACGDLSDLSRLLSKALKPCVRYTRVLFACWGVRSSHWEIRSSHWDFLRSHWELNASHWDSLSSHWDSRASHWDSRASHWDSRFSHWDFRSSHWDFPSSHWDFWFSYFSDLCLPRSLPLQLILSFFCYLFILQGLLHLDVGPPIVDLDEFAPKRYFGVEGEIHGSI